MAMKALSAFIQGWRQTGAFSRADQARKLASGFWASPASLVLAVAFVGVFPSLPERTSAAGSIAAAGAAGPVAAAKSAAEPAMIGQGERAWAYLKRAISPADGLPGAILASPSRTKPDYYYHWTRDAALVTMGVVRECRTRPLEADWCRATLIDLIEFARLIQRSNALTGAGEPKFYVDGRPYDLPWGRPQTDGPALRAIAFIELANQWLDAGDEREVRRRLYGGEGLPARTPVKVDLEYVAHNWRLSSFDLWEEVLGDHFYTRLAQRRALLEGAALADRLGDFGAAAFYREQAHSMEGSVAAHWNDQRNLIRPTLRRVDGLEKPQELDVAVVLASLHARGADGFFGPTDDRVLATAERIRAEFARLYSLNRGKGSAVAIGRYPEDHYDGEAGTGTAHPWFLATHAYAELCYLAAREFEARGRIEINDLNRSFFKSLEGRFDFPLDGHRAYVSGSPEFDRLTSALRAQGDSFLRVSLAHMDQNDGSMSEQFHRDTGYMLSAVHLTWSYASYLSALASR